MSLKFFQFTVVNTRTKESAHFLGQGETMAQAWKDAVDNVAAPFRHKQDSRPHPPLRMTVTLPTGQSVNRTQKLFESDLPWDPKTEGEMP